MGIKGKRIEANLTQLEVSENLGVDRSTVTKWETGASMPSGITLIKLARFFGCTIDELLRDDTAADAPAPAERAG